MRRGPYPPPLVDGPWKVRNNDLGHLGPVTHPSSRPKRGHTSASYPYRSCVHRPQVGPRRVEGKGVDGDHRAGPEPLPSRTRQDITPRSCVPPDTPGPPSPWTSGKESPSTLPPHPGGTRSGDRSSLPTVGTSRLTPLFARDPYPGGGGGVEPLAPLSSPTPTSTYSLCTSRVGSESLGVGPGPDPQQRHSLGRAEGRGRCPRPATPLLHSKTGTRPGGRRPETPR